MEFWYIGAADLCTCVLAFDIRRLQILLLMSFKRTKLGFCIYVSIRIPTPAVF